MTTTNYILELFIAGICALLWVFLLSFSVFGFWIPIEMLNLKNENALMWFLLLSPISYTLGVIMDRFVDNAFDRVFNNKFRNKIFKNEREYREARSKVYLSSEPLTEIFEYGRMRIRICRNWIFNSIMTILTFDLFLLRFTLEENLKLKIFVFFNSILVFSIYIAFVSWRSLNIKEYQFLKIQSEIIENEQNQ